MVVFRHTLLGDIAAFVAASDKDRGIFFACKCRFSLAYCGFGKAAAQKLSSVGCVGVYYSWSVVNPTPVRIARTSSSERERQVVSAKISDT